MDDDLGGLHARSQRYNRHDYCLAMCDVDFFKAYNEAYGHQAGDEVLRKIAATLAAQARQGDGVYRYGGEAFLLVLPEQSLSSGAVPAERIRGAVENLGIAHSATRTPLWSRSASASPSSTRVTARPARTCSSRPMSRPTRPKRMVGTE